MKVVKNKYYLIVGLTLGDGYIDNKKNRNKSMLDIAHHISHKDYIEYKKKLLEQAGFVVNQNIKTNSKGVKLYRISTRYYKIMRDIRKVLYNEETGLRVFPKKFINKLSLFHLMLLYLDDGCLCHRKSKKGTDNYYIELCVANYDLKSVQNMKLWIEKLGYKVNIHQISKYKKAGKPNGYVLRMNKTNSSIFINNIKDYVVKNIPSMEYKVNPLIS